MSKLNNLFFRDGSGQRIRFGYWARAALLIPLGSFATCVFGADWFFQPAVTLGTGYEENAELTSIKDQQIDSFRYEVGARVRGGRLTERLQVIGSLGASYLRYPGHGRLDSDNLSATLGTDFLPNELNRFSIDLGFDRDTTRTSELTTTGNIRSNVPRDAIRVGAGWEHQLTPRSTVGLGYTHTRIRYDEASGESVGPGDEGFVDSDEDNIDASYTYSLTERLDLRGALGATSYDPENDRSYKGFDVSLGASYALSESLAGDMDIGWQRIELDTGSESGSSTRTTSGLLLGFSLAKEFDRSSLRLSARKDRIPNGSGNLTQQETVAVGYAYELSPRMSVTLPVAIYRNKTLSFGDNTDGGHRRRIFLTTEPSLSWRVTEDLVLTASYRYEYEREKNGETTTADSNAVFLSLSYIWPTEVPGLSQ